MIVRCPKCGCNFNDSRWEEGLVYAEYRCLQCDRVWNQFREDISEALNIPIPNEVQADLVLDFLDA